jgi:hypothetical protein
MNADRHVLIQVILSRGIRPDAKRRLVAGVNDTGLGPDGQSGDAIRSQLKLANVRGEFGFGHVFGRDNGVCGHSMSIVAVTIAVIHAGHASW